MKYKDHSDEEYFDISDRILELSDELSEEIILTNIGDQFSQKLDVFADNINYISLFRNKYTEITSQTAFYDKNYVRDALTRVSELAKSLLFEKYGIGLGNDLDFYFPDDYLKDLETLYEFFFIRQFKNLVDYFFFQLMLTKTGIIKRYEKLFEEDETHNDIFVLQAKKKFKNPGDVVIIHFINEIIEDIESSMESAYMLFDTIINIEPFEEFNARTKELMEDYGNGITFKGDRECYMLYMQPLKDQSIRSELRNHLLMKYLESCELEDK